MYARIGVHNAGHLAHVQRKGSLLEWSLHLSCGKRNLMNLYDTIATIYSSTRTSSEFPQITASFGRTTVGVGACQLLERGLVVDNFIAIDLEQHLGLLLGARYILLAPRAGPTTALVFDQQMQALHLIGSITAGAGRFLGRFGWLIPL